MQGKYGIQFVTNDSNYYHLDPEGQLYRMNDGKYIPYYQPLTMNNVSYINLVPQEINNSDHLLVQQMQGVIDTHFNVLTNTADLPFNWDTFAEIGITPDGYKPVNQQQIPGFTGGGGFPGAENYTGGGFNFVDVGGFHGAENYTGGGFNFVDVGGFTGQEPYNYHFSFGNHTTYSKYLDALINASLPILLSLVAPKAIYAAAERFGYEAIANSPLTGVCAFALAGIATYKLQNRYLHSIEARSACEAMVRKMYSLTAEEYKPGNAYSELHENDNKEARRLQLMTWVPAASVGLCYTASAYLACSWIYNQPELEIPSAVVTILIGGTGILAGLLTSMRAEAVATEQYIY